MANTIQPDRQTVEQCLKNKTYYVDFYQREYVWNEETVLTLLTDIFDVFEQSYLSCGDADLTPITMDKNFSWYYLNVFITNKIDSKNFIVDGQQRLSTLTLICTKLYHLTKNQDLKDLLVPCICGKNWTENVYIIDHAKRAKAMDAIFKNEAFEGAYKNKTEETIIERYKYISNYFDKKNMDERKLSAFIYYFLYKLVLVELCIDNQDDTAMVFEVINDRGEDLKPFEILKGKLIGALSKDDTDNYSELWDAALLQIQEKEDEFFQTLLKSKFIFTRQSEKEKRINNEYQRYIFDQKNEDATALGFRKTDSNRINNIKNFIQNDVSYYSKLYAKIIKNEDMNLFYTNKTHQLDGQYLLILSACSINDEEEDKKIELIAKEYERLYMLLRMNGVYESNDFHGITYELNKTLKGLPIEEYRKVFDQAIINQIKESLKVDTVNSVLEYSRFSKLEYSTSTYFYYLLARIEDYICSKINITTENDVHYISTKHSAQTGYHIEHIFSNNEENIKLFESEDEFWAKRNGIGGLLLLRGRNNISSGNEKYEDKLKTYFSGPNYAKTLCKDFYHSNPDFIDFNNNLEKQTGQKFVHYDSFTPESMEERCKLLYELVKIIWDI